MVASKSDIPRVGVAVDGSPESPRQLVDWRKALDAYADLDGIDPEREAYLSHFVFGPEMVTHHRANGGSVKGFAGPCWAKWLVFDIDRQELAEALTDARRLVAFLTERFPETDGAMPVFFSGRKGFHVCLELPELEPSATFHEVAKTLADGLARAAGVVVDLSIYDRNRIIRLPNSRHAESGLFKRRIDADDLMRLSVERVGERATQPAGDGFPSASDRMPNVLRDWEAAARLTSERSRERAGIRKEAAAGETRVPRYLLEFIRFGTPEGERALTLFRCAAFLSEIGCPPNAVNAILDEPGRDNGLLPAEVKRQIQCGIEHACRQQSHKEQTHEA